MFSVESMLEKLALRRAELRIRINAMSPTAQLPAEILIEIFWLVCQPSTNGRLITPLFFGSICKEWRDMAWSTPLLWNAVSLHVSSTMRRSQVDLLREWLMRANTLPLYIKLIADSEDDSTLSSIRSIMNVLVVRSMYWYSFDCVLPLQCHDILEGHRFPMLASVSVHPPKGTISTFSEPPNMFLSAPKLRDAELWGYHFPSMLLPWGQLIRFKTQFLTITECLKVLRRSPMLKECHLESVYSPEIIASPVSGTLYSDLETLDVVLIKGAALSLFHSITLPSLRDLRVSYGGVGGALLSAIQSLIIRSGCKLKRLCIENPSFRDDDLIACLETTPSLTHLRLRMSSDRSHTFMGLTENFLSRLNPSRHAALILPNLTSLRYHGRVFCDALTFSLHLSARQRWCDLPILSRLSVVEILSTAKYEVAPGVYEVLKQLRATGLVISIESIESV